MTVHFHLHAHMPQAPAFLEWLQEHLEAEGVQVHRTPQRLHLQIPQIGTLEFHSASPDSFACDIVAVDHRMAELIELSMDEHAQEFLADHGAPLSALQLHWSGLPATDLRHRFQAVEVLAVQDITPHMRRVRLRVPVMSAFASEGLHVRLLLPPRNGAPIQWPSIDADGRLQSPPGQPPLPQRIYTIRSRSDSERCLDIDIVRHAHDAPGAQWIAQVQAGDTVGLLGPAGGSIPQAQHLLLAADMTALPAALRIAQQQSARGGTWQLLALGVHADDAAYVPAAANVQWHTGSTDSHAAAVTAWLCSAATLQPPCTLWVAGSQVLVKALRAWLNTPPALPLNSYKLAVYWK